MQKTVLSNGLKIIYHKKRSPSVIIQVMIKVGSNDEKSSERGLTHFIEHMLFEGTKNKPTNREITNEIEKIGGDFNAYTTNERTCYYIKVLKKHFSIAIDTLTDILQNSLFSEKQIAKEKNIVIQEINLVYDEPRYYQWVLLQKNLFKNHPCKYPTYGEKEIIRHLTKEKIIEYFRKYYVPNNMVISIVGNVPFWKRMIKKCFKQDDGSSIKKIKIKEPLSTKNIYVKEKRRITNTYLLMGFKTVPRIHPDSYVLDVINGILGRGQSGKMLNEIRNKQGLAYEVGTQHVSEANFGYYAVYATIDKKNMAKVKKIILNELKKLEQVSEEDITEAKEYIEGDYLLELEDNQKVADQLLFWEQVKNADLMKDFLKKIKQVSQKDVKRVAKKYFKNYAQVILEGK